MERVLVKIRMKELLEVGLVEVSKGEYALTTIMFFSIKIFLVIGLNIGVWRR
jgi:hypothetical protein